jgi:hypothetical protein
MGHYAESLTTVLDHSKFIEKLATTFKGTVKQKVYIYICNAVPKAYTMHA